MINLKGGMRDLVGPEGLIEFMVSRELNLGLPNPSPIYYMYSCVFYYILRNDSLVVFHILANLEYI